MQKTSILFSLIGTFAFGNSTDPLLKGALIVDDASLVKKEYVGSVEGVQFEGATAPSEELVSLLKDYPLSTNGAEGLSKVISSYYETNQDYRYSVTVPEQDVSSGVVQLVVAPERLEKISVKENQYTDANSLTKWVRTSSANPIHKKTMAEDIGWLNENPYRSVELSYGEGSQPGFTNVDLIVKDKKNWNVSTGVENTGTMPIGTTRVFGEIAVNDFIFKDHTFTLKGVAADHYSEYQLIKGTYVAQLPWRNKLVVSGDYSSQKPDRAPYPHRNRESYAVSTRYQIPQWFSENLWVDKITWEAGFDFKGANSNLVSEDEPAVVEDRLAYVSQLAGGIAASRERKGTKLKAKLDLIGSPMEFLPHQTSADFGNLREGATAAYVYSRVDLSLSQALPFALNLSAKGRGQFSPSKLIPSEQLVLGGYSTVRGYQEKVVSGDNSLCGNLEISSPKVAPVGMWLPRFNDNLTVLGFVDGGYAWFNGTSEGISSGEALLGVGSGLRYSVGSYFSSRLDLGVPLMKVKKDDTTSPHIHFNAVFSY